MLPVGYKNPPVEHRFPPGVSGNPAGGKRGPRNKKRRPHPFDLVKEFTAGDNRVKMTVAERLILTARSRAVATLDKKLEVALQRAKDRVDKAALKARVRVDTIYHYNVLWYAGSVLLNSNDAVQHLGIGRLLRPYSSNPRVVLEPFIVQQALDQMERNQLTLEEQRKVMESTRSAWSLRFPDWWDDDAKPKKRASGNKEKPGQRNVSSDQ